MKKKSDKCLIVDKLINEGWFQDEKEVQSWIMLKRILVNDQLIYSSSEKVPNNCIIRVKEYYKRKYTNKGGLKLEGALKDFNIDVTNLVALDCGASTGGFTDCLLYYGAQMVYAVDVGHGQLAGKLLINEKVRNLENTNLSNELLKALNPLPEIITLDLSYLSLKIAVPICFDILKNQGVIICLVKPIYEVESHEIRRNGKINDNKIIREILFDLSEYFIKLGCNIIGITNSPVKGNNDTLEYFIGLTIGNASINNINNEIKSHIEVSLKKSQEITSFKKNEYY